MVAGTVLLHPSSIFPCTLNRTLRSAVSPGTYDVQSIGKRRDQSVSLRKQMPVRCDPRAVFWQDTAFFYDFFIQRFMLFGITYMCPPVSSIQAIIAEIAKSDTIIYLDDLLPIVYDYFKLPVAGNSVPVLHRKQLRKSVCAKVVRNYRLPDTTIIADLFQCCKYIFLVSVYLELHILLLKVNLLSWHAFSAISLFSI